MIARAYNEKIYHRLKGLRDISTKRKEKEAEFLAYMLLADEIFVEL